MRIALTFVLLAACGGGAAENHETTAPTASASASTASPDVWSDSMSKEQQVAFMKAKVLPTMTQVFQAHDGKKYAAFGCKTCHGPAFKEPKDFLPHLTFKDGKLKEAAEKPEMAKFMMDQVTPAMVTALGEKPYDPQAHTGFGCGGCHTIDMK